MFLSRQVGGFAALVGAIVTGPRIGAFKDAKACACWSPVAEGKPNLPHKEHNRMYAALGVAILWFGWYGFNAGSTLDITGYGSNAARITVTTTLSAASAAITVMICSLVSSNCRTFDLMAPLNGVLAGLVSITAPCNVVSPEGAVGIGIIGGIVYFCGSKVVKLLRIDDPLDAFAVHGLCGAWGVLSVGPFAIVKYVCGSADSDCMDNGSQSLMQLVGCLLIMVWTVGTSLIAFMILRVTGQLRVTEEDEVRGMDALHHAGYTGILRLKEEMASTEAAIIPMLKMNTQNPDTKVEQSVEAGADLSAN